MAKSKFSEEINGTSIFIPDNSGNVREGKVLALSSQAVITFDDKATVWYSLDELKRTLKNVKK